MFFGTAFETILETNFLQMKQTLFLILIIIFSNFSLAQDSNYEILWSKVKQLEIDGLPKSALKIVEDIAQLAKKDNNTPQHIKTMLFKSKFALILEEDSPQNIY